MANPYPDELHYPEGVVRRMIAEAVEAEREACAQTVEEVMIASAEEVALAKHVARCVRRQPRV